MEDDDIVDVVDEFVDDLNPNRLESEAERLGISWQELLDRVMVEAKARLS